MPKLSHEEQVAFLDERKVGLRLGCTREDGSPIVVPISFLHQDGEIYFTPRAKSEWFGCLRKDPRVALCIDELPLPMRKMIIEGEAELPGLIDCEASTPAGMPVEEAMARTAELIPAAVVRLLERYSR